MRTCKHFMIIIQYININILQPIAICTYVHAYVFTKLAMYELRLYIVLYITECAYVYIHMYT